MFSYLIGILIKSPFRNTHTAVAQLPDTLQIGSGKPHYLYHWHYLLSDLKALNRKWLDFLRNYSPVVDTDVVDQTGKEGAGLHGIATANVQAVF